jgi:D-alanyl-D-alanine carboxypeptidase
VSKIIGYWVLFLMALSLVATGFGPPAIIGPEGTQQPFNTYQVEYIQRMAPPGLSAEGAVLMDVATGRVLFARNPYERYAPASLTKIVTALVALDHAKISDKVKIDLTWSDLPADSSVMGLSAGEELTIEGLLYGLLLVSGNDAAVVIAKKVGGSEAVFVDMMNEKVRELGLRDTHFDNPHGLDSATHFSSSYDLAVLGRRLLANPDLARIVSSKQERVIGTGGIGIYPMRNINRIVQAYPGGDGIKTGYTDLAKQTVVASANTMGSRAIAVVMRSDGYAADAASLLDYAFYAHTGVKPEPEAYPPGLQDTELDRLRFKGPLLAEKMLVPRWERPYLTTQLWLSPTSSGTPGRSSGFLSFSLDGLTVLQRPLYEP